MTENMAEPYRTTTQELEPVLDGTNKRQTCSKGCFTCTKHQSLLLLPPVSEARTSTRLIQKSKLSEDDRIMRDFIPRGRGNKSKGTDKSYK